MATETTNLHLQKWDSSDFADIPSAWNANMDAIDSNINNLSETIETVNEGVGFLHTELTGAIKAAFDFDNLASMPGVTYAATESGGIWTETIKKGSTTQATRTSTPTASGWTVRTVAPGYDRTVTYTENGSGWTAVVGG